MSRRIIKAVLRATQLRLFRSFRRRHPGLRGARHPRARDHVADGQGRGHPALGRRPLPPGPAAQPLALAAALRRPLLPDGRARGGLPVRGAQPERHRRQQDGQGQGRSVSRSAS